MVEYKGYGIGLDIKTKIGEDIDNWEDNNTVIEEGCYIG